VIGRSWDKSFGGAVAASVALLLASVAALACPPMSAVAAGCPTYNGALTFEDIDEPGDPEDYCWEVQLYEDQELVQVDDRHAVVYYSSGHRAFGIEATAAHDAEGASVPTTLAVSGANVITFAVHHRAGNPAAGGDSFAYPISAGPGWEGGFQTFVVPGPPDESEVQQTPSSTAEETRAPRCEVPGLYGRSLKAARRALRHAHCGLGPVRGRRSRGARVVKQYRETGTVLPAGTEVGVKLAP
jgi:hypothetical protein